MTEGRTRSSIRRAAADAVAADGTGVASVRPPRPWAGQAATHVTPSRTKAMPRATARPGGPARLIAVAGARLLVQALELAGVLARDLVDHVGRQVAELLFDELRRLGPHPVGVRVVRRPHERLGAHLVDHLGVDPIE